MKPSEEIVRFFEKDRFAAETGAVIDEIDDRYAEDGGVIEGDFDATAMRDAV